jgi:hypothetical protein
MTLTNIQSNLVQFQGAKCCFWSSFNNLLLSGKNCLDLYACYNFTLIELDSNEIFAMPVITTLVQSFSFHGLWFVGMLLSCTYILAELNVV